MPEIIDNSEKNLIVTDNGNSIPGFGFMALFLTIQVLANRKKIQNKKTEKK